MKIYFTCFSNERFEEHRKNLCKKANGIFDGVFEYTYLDLPDFYKNTSDVNLYSSSIWKPYIIFDVLNKIEDNDCVFYLDCGDIFLNEIIDFLRDYFIHNDILLVDGNAPNKYWTKYDCFYLMGCNEPKYHDVIQLEAGISGFKKTSLTMSFISEYMAFCRTSEIAFPWIANLYGNNYPGFIAHRGDQSVLTNLKIKYNLYSCSGNHIIRQLVRCNVNGKSFKAWNE